MGRHAQLPTDALHGIHVLVVDGDPSARQLIRMVLSYCGGLVTEADSAARAMRVLLRVLPDVLLISVALPDGDAYRLVHDLRALPDDRGGAMPAVALIDGAVIGGPDHILGAGFQAQLRKPFDPWELCRMAAALARRP